LAGRKTATTSIIEQPGKKSMEQFIPVIEGGLSMAAYEESTFLSITGDPLTKLVWRPKGTPKGVVQLTHGMAEHIRRYDGLAQALQNRCDREVHRLKVTMDETEERRRLIIEAIDYKDDTIKKLESLSKKAVKEYIDRISKANPFTYYKSFIGDKELFSCLAGDRVDFELIEPIRKYTKDLISSGYIEIEDLAPIIYLKYRIYGMDEKIPVKHIVIDEAQDFSVFQLYVIKKIIKDSSFTILGDLCQGIHSYRGTRDWEDVMKYAFEEGQCQLLTLEQSYRTQWRLWKLPIRWSAV
jgi:DNA helicase-2/ATP-dependent DNA helicase PcrA